MFTFEHENRRLPCVCGLQASAKISHYLILRVECKVDGLWCKEKALSGLSKRNIIAISLEK